MQSSGSESGGGSDSSSSSVSDSGSDSGGGVWERESECVLCVRAHVCVCVCVCTEGYAKDRESVRDNDEESIGNRELIADSHISIRIIQCPEYVLREQ